MKNLIQFTNVKLANWYKNAKLDCNVSGSGTAKIEENKFIINYIENGVSKEWSTYFCDEYLRTQSKEYFYTVWMEQA